MKSRLLALAVVLVSAAAVFAQEAEDGKAPSWCVAVWYPSSDVASGYESILVNVDIIDTVNPFWYTARPDGTLHPSNEAEDAEKLADWKTAGLIVMPAIFSNGWTMIDGEEDRANHIGHIVDLVERMDYGGIDIDYEGFSPSTREHFSLFVEGLAQELHARGRLLSIAVHAKTDPEGSWGGAAAQDWTRLAAAVDVFRIMTYDYTSRNEPPGPIGPPQWSMDVLAYAQSVTDLANVRLGLHFYGYSWQRGTPPSTPVTWANFNRWVEAFQLEVMRDQADMEAYVDFKVPGLPRQTVYVSDAVGLAYKLNLVLEAFPDLGGVAIWGLGDEDPGNWELLRTMAQGECALVSE
jgi:spore germination protein